MDPTETLNRIRELLKDQDTYDLTRREIALNDLVSYVAALDEWIMRGGFLPADWSLAQMRGPA